jgi:hypothetical protein
MQLGGVIATTDSTNWSGLGGAGSGIEGAEGEWTVPAIEPSTSALYSASWVGVDGMNNTDLIQTGTAQDTNDGYDAWVEILPAAEQEIFRPGGGPAQVEPGDQINAYVAETATSDMWTIYIQDSTQNWYFQQNFRYHGPGQSAEWIEEAPTVGGEQSTPADFGTVDFSGTEIYGDFGSSGTAWYSTDMDADNEIAMVDQAGTTTLAMPSAPSVPSSSGQGFSDTYVTAPGTPTDLVATAGINSAYLSWQSPTYDGGTPIVGYDVNEYLSRALQQTINLTSTSTTVTGLTPGNFYSFSVAAYSSGNWTSAYSATTPPVTPIPVTPIVTAVSPITGTTAGGTRVTITGTGFAGATMVDFGTTGATSVAVGSSTSITATSPQEPVGTVDVTVTTAGGTSAISTADQFTYISTSLPSATTGAATSVGPGSATLNGSVGPNGSAATYYFEYGTTTSYGSTTSSTSAGSGTSTVAETASLTGLGAGTTYDFQLVVTNSNGTTDGGNLTFTTGSTPLPPPPLPPPPVTLTLTPVTVTLTPVTVTLMQGGPTSATVSYGAGYSGESLTVTNATGTVSYTEATSMDSADVVVSSRGSVSGAASLTPGTYEVGGGDSDASGDTGTWSFYLKVVKASQSVTFTAPSGGAVNGSASLSPTASSGLTVTLSVDGTTTHDACSISGDTVRYFNAGSCIIEANQAGDADYRTASPVHKTITVGMAKTKVTLKLSATKVTYGDEQTELLSVTVLAQYSGTALGGTVTIKTSATTLSVIILSSGRGWWTMSDKKLKPGAYHLVGTYSGSKNFKGSISAKETLTIAT